MSTVEEFENLIDLIVELRGQSVLLDSDVAGIYKVETKRVNEAVKNNPDKFPQDSMFEISESEFVDLRSKVSTTKFPETRISYKEGKGAKKNLNNKINRSIFH